MLHFLDVFLKNQVGMTDIMSKVGDIAPANSHDPWNRTGLATFRRKL
jgi:hypothetical protein